MTTTRAWLLAVAFGLLSTALASAEANAGYGAEIRRTEFGIPHIKAKDYGGLGYGLAYAYAQDNFCLLADRIVTVNGERSKYFGPDAPVQLLSAAVKNIASDFFFKGVMNESALHKAADALPKGATEYMRGYVAGYNRYLRDTGTDRVPLPCRGAAWLRAMTYDDQLRLVQDRLLQGDFESPLIFRALIDAAPPGPQHASLTPARTQPDGIGDADVINTAGLGSNGWAFGSAVTSNGSGILLGNPHYPWQTVNRFYEAHLTIPGKLDVMGATLPGGDGVIIGFNKDVAWTHTISTDRQFTLLELTLDPHDPTVYVVDGVKHQMIKKTVSVEIMQSGRTEVQQHEFYSTIYGPVVVASRMGLDWSNARAYAIRDTNFGDFHAWTADMNFGRAHSVAEIRSLLSETRLPYINTLATDRHGDVLYADITPAPDVTEDVMTSCAPSPDAAALAKRERIFVLDGSKSRCMRGLMPAKLMPQLIRKDFVANSNNSFWLANPASPITAEPPIVGEVDTPQNLRTRAGLIEISRRLKGQDGLPGTRVSPADLQDMIFRNWDYAADLVLDDLLADCAQGNSATADNGTTVSIDKACAILAKWDRHTNLDSRGAYLFAEIWDQLDRMNGIYATPFDPNDPIHTPRGLNNAPETVALVRRAIATAVATISDAGLPLDAPLGQEQFYVDGQEHIPLDGGSGFDGVLNVVKTELVKGEGYEPTMGSSYMQIVTFDQHGPVARGILTYSQSTNPASPHYADQTRLFASKKLIPLPFSDAEIAADKALTSIMLRE